MRAVIGKTSPGWASAGGVGKHPLLPDKAGSVRAEGLPGPPSELLYLALQLLGVLVHWLLVSGLGLILVIVVLELLKLDGLLVAWLATLLLFISRLVPQGQHGLLHPLLYPASGSPLAPASSAPAPIGTAAGMCLPPPGISCPPPAALPGAALGPGASPPAWCLTGML